MNPNPLIPAPAAVQTPAQDSAAAVTSSPVASTATATAPASTASTSSSSTKLLSLADLFNVGLGSLEILAAQLKIPGIAAAAGIAEEVVPLFEAAIEKLLQVKGSTTTYGQLESLRFTPKW